MDERDNTIRCQFKKWLRRTTIFNANALYLLAAAGAFLVPWGAGELRALVPALRGMDLSAWLTCIYQIGFLALPCSLYALRHKGVGQSMRLAPPDLAPMLYAMLAAVFGLFFTSKLGELWLLLIQKLGGRTLPASMEIPTTSDALARALLLVAVVPGVCEELFFRGALLGAWERRGAGSALIVSSCLFCFLHGSIQGLPVQLLLGFVLGYVVLSSGSVYVGMLYHTVHNGMALVFAYLGNTAPAEGEVSLYQDAARYIAQHGGAGLFLMELLGSALLFAVSLLLFRLHRMRTGEALDKVAVPDKRPMGWQELLVLLAALVTVSTFYVEDLFIVCGIIG